jgi:hypothetical protein
VNRELGSTKRDGVRAQHERQHADGELHFGSWPRSKRHALRDEKFQ